MPAPEIPAGGEHFRVTRILCRDLALAAACMADNRVPRLELEEISVTVDGDGPRLVQFNFPNNPDVSRIFAAWKACQHGKPCSDPITAAIYRAFHYWKAFVDIIDDGDLQPRPAVIPEGFEWTTNTKIPATVLALLPGKLIEPARLARMVYRNGRECGYVLAGGRAAEAYDEPEAYLEAHPDEPLSYIVAAFAHRDHLRDLVKQMPARHIFRNPEDNSIHLVPEPQPEKETVR